MTEYGIADLRGKSDEQCIKAMLSVTDARFQEALCRQATDAGKLRRDFVIPPAWRANTPERLEAALGPFRDRGLFAPFPFGSDFTAEELRLIPALKKLQQIAASKAGFAAFALAAVIRREREGDAAALERMGLASTRGAREWLLRKLLVQALAQPATP